MSKMEKSRYELIQTTKTSDFNLLTLHYKNCIILLTLDNCSGNF